MAVLRKQRSHLLVDAGITTISACGREVGSDEIAHAKEVVRLCSGLSRTELAQTLCEHWEWIGPTGKPQLRACGKVLDNLDKLGIIELPSKRRVPRKKRKRPGKPVLSELTVRQPNVECDLASLKPIRLEQAEESETKELWNEFVERYHPLGYKAPFGCSLRYFVTSKQGRLGCVYLASAAKALRCRDEWIDWSVQQRLSNLPWVINNNRFLIFPWVTVPHLASHVLGQLARQVQNDWKARWGYRPVLMETFVDPAHYRGVCYRAAGWQIIGETTGGGLRLKGHSYKTTPKLIFVRPLERDFRKRLCSLPSTRRSCL